MSQVNFWSKVGVDVQTALGAAIAITSISKNNPALVTYSGTPNPLPANGAYVVLDVSGMVEVNQRVFRIASVDTNAKTFVLEGEDATDYGTFTAGTAQLITFGASMKTAVGVNASGGEPKFAEVTTVHDEVEKEAPTVLSGMTMSFDSLWDPTDPALLELRKATQAKGKRAVLLRFSTGAKLAFTSYPACSLVPTGNAQEAVKTSVSFKAQGLPTAYGT